MPRDSDGGWTVKANVDGGLKPFAGVSEDGSANVTMVDSDKNLMVKESLLSGCLSVGMMRNIVRTSWILDFS